AARAPEVLRRETGSALTALGDAGALPPQGVRELSEALALLRHLRALLALLCDGVPEPANLAGPAGATLARCAGAIDFARRDGDRGVARLGRLARQVQEEARAAVHPRLGYGWQGVRELRRLGREEHVWPQIHGHRPQHLPDRQGRRRARRLAQGQGARSCRRSPESGERALSERAASLAEGAAAILATAEPAEKVALSRELAAQWRNGAIGIGCAVPPSRPARPARPDLLPPRDMPKRRNFGSQACRIAL